MYSIKQVSERTGLSTYTLRYYEKLGVLPLPARSKGNTRKYSESDIQLIIFLDSLKKTGMPLKDIKEFLRDGCILQKIDTNENIRDSLERRIGILTKHKIELERQKAEIGNILRKTDEKLEMYFLLLKNKTNKPNYQTEEMEGTQISSLHSGNIPDKG